MQHRHWLAWTLLVPTLIVAALRAARADETDTPVSPITATTPAPAAASAADLVVPAAFRKPAPEGLDDLRAMEAHVQALSQRALHSTVSVQVGRAQGSGVIVTADGYVLTAAHVIGRSGRKCFVIFPDGKKYEAETLGSNRTLDAGMVVITDKPPQESGWPHAAMADPKSIDAGDWCLAMGHPGGFRDDRLPVVRLGRVIVTGKRVLQSDCELVGGDSGGPLFDMQGRVIGINSRIMDDTSANFHVPISAYQDGWDRLVAGELFSSHSGSLLGVRVEAATQGVRVTRVFPGDPAEAAGLLAGDVILTFQSRRVTSQDQLTELVGQENPGETVRLEILREGKPMTLRVRLGWRWD